MLIGLVCKEGLVQMIEGGRVKITVKVSEEMNKGGCQQACECAKTKR